MKHSTFYLSAQKCEVVVVVVESQ